MQRPVKTWQTVAIVGVGLIGGSIGLALRRRGLAEQVVGIGRRASTLRTARQVGAITSSTQRLAQGVASAELVVVCTPVEKIVGHVRETAAACQPGTLITDAGSIKAPIVAQLADELPTDAHFVGSHPLAGSERSGPAEASAELFTGRMVLVTPTRKTRRDDVAAVSRFWESLGATVVSMSPDRHDQILAMTSHLPHAIAAAAAATIGPAQLRFCGTGWSDTTRVAGGDPELWTQILLGNRDHVVAALSRFEQTLTRLRHALERNDRAGVKKLLSEAQRKRHAVDPSK